MPSSLDHFCLWQSRIPHAPIYVIAPLRLAVTSLPLIVFLRKTFGGINLLLFGAGAFGLAYSYGRQIQESRIYLAPDDKAAVHRCVLLAACVVRLPRRQGY